MADFDGEAVALEDVLERFLDAREDELSVAMPGEVVRYDAEAQTADVRPLIHRALPRADAAPVREPLPIVRAVPVCWPRAGRWYVHMPLAAGDTVLLVCCDRDPSRWRRTGQPSDPIDTRTHHLAHAVAIPGVYPRTGELGDTPADALVIGRDGGATVRIREDGQVHVAGSEELALAGNLDTHLGKIAKSLDEIRTALSGVIDPNYGVAAKAALDASDPIPTTNTRGS